MEPPTSAKPKWMASDAAELRSSRSSSARIVGEQIDVDREAGVLQTQLVAAEAHDARSWAVVVAARSAVIAELAAGSADSCDRAVLVVAD
jgi:hypothetical protein